MSYVINKELPLNTKNVPTVAELRRAGYRVRVQHGYVDQDDDMSRLAWRYTRVDISKDGVTGTGYSYVSYGDNWNRKLGIRIAIGRAIKDSRRLHFNTTPPNVTFA